MLTPALDNLHLEARHLKPLVIAHRGASGLAPENTLAAFSLAVALGADGVEFDVQLTADGRPVVIHDRRVNRTTNGGGNVSRLTLEHIHRLDAGAWFDRRLSRRPRVRSMISRMHIEAGVEAPRYSGEPVPSLDDLLALLKPARLERIYIELKGSKHLDPLLESVVALVNKHRIAKPVTLLSFNHAIVVRAKELDGNIRTAALFPARGRRLVSTRSIIRSAESAGVDEVALHYGLATRRSIDALHERGFWVSVWTANGPLAMRRIAAAGADSIMTNFPNRLRELLDSGGTKKTSGYWR
jgi:glycerophosphoryl diester phosphodiesterase